MGGVNEWGCLVVPQGACFLSLPRPAPVSSLTQDQTSPLPSIPPSLLPSGSTIGSPFALLDQSPRHRLCLSSVHNICSRSLYAPLGKSLSIPDGALSEKASMALAPSALTATGTECWNPIIHLISICSFNYRPNLCIPSHPSFFFYFAKCITKKGGKKACLHFELKPQLQHHIKFQARSKNINLIVLHLDSWPQAGGRNVKTEGEYQMRSLWLGHSSPKHIAQADQ